MSNIRNFKRNSTLFSFIFLVKRPEVDMPGPWHDRCIPELVLHGTVLIKDFSVISKWQCRMLTLLMSQQAHVESAHMWFHWIKKHYVVSLLDTYLLNPLYHIQNYKLCYMHLIPWIPHELVLAPPTLGGWRYYVFGLSIYLSIRLSFMSNHPFICLLTW